MVNYSVIFTYNKEDSRIDNSLDKYICSDNKIHIRLRDFNKEMFLIGFERKLTYLLSYLINYSYIPKLIGEYSEQDVLESFLLSEDVLNITSFIEQLVDNTLGFEGLLLSANYKRSKTNYKYFGKVKHKYFPLNIKNDLIEIGNLAFFLKAFNVTLYDFLLDDNYVIWLHDKNLEVTKKFDRRQSKKAQTAASRNKDIAKLW